jgi:hypothetical protein
MNMRNVFFDCEFTGLRQDTDLISIGLVAPAMVGDSEKTFYAELTDYDQNKITPWIQHNVISKLKLSKWDIDRDYHPYSNAVTFKGTRIELEQALSHWIHQLIIESNCGKVKMWSDCLAYDWVLFCDLMTQCNDLSFPAEEILYIPFDICTLFEDRGINPDIDREKFAFGEVYSEMLEKKHNALWDARVIFECYNKLMKIDKGTTIPQWMK